MEDMLLEREQQQHDTEMAAKVKQEEEMIWVETVRAQTRLAELTALATAGS